ncbi:hypothetical protein PV326_009336 [Microctonus aethiopoides]|nr:hypothetical protein PV326_009336 [Microctonus aethiopoides]
MATPPAMQPSEEVNSNTTERSLKRKRMEKRGTWKLVTDIIRRVPICKNTAENNYIAAENIVRQRRDNVATSMDNEGRSGAAEKRNETNGPVEEAQGRRGLRQTSWKAQLPVDHADPIDRRIFVASLDKIIWWR